MCGKKRQCVKHNLVQMHEVLGSKGMRQFQFRATQEAICPFPLRPRGCGCGISLVACAISLINLVGLSAHVYARCTSMYCTRISLCSWLAMKTQLKKKKRGALTNVRGSERDRERRVRGTGGSLEWWGNKKRYWIWSYLLSFCARVSSGSRRTRSTLWRRRKRRKT